MEDSVLYQRMRWVEQRLMFLFLSTFYFLITIYDVSRSGKIEPLFLLLGCCMLFNARIDRSLLKNGWLHTVWVVAICVCFIWFRDGIVLWT